MPTELDSETDPLDEELEREEAARAERKAGVEKARKTQRILDIRAVNELEELHGDSNIAVVNVPFTPGLPTLVALRTPTEVEMKRFKFRMKAKSKGGADPTVDTEDAISGAEELALKCLVYPDKETFEKVLEARPGVLMQCGSAALALSQGSAEAKGKG